MMKAISTKLALYRSFYFGCLLLCLLSLISGCQVVQAIPPTATDLPPSPSPLPTATFTPPPPTPSPSPDKVILVAPPDTSPSLAQEAAERIQRLAAGSGLVFEDQTSLSPETPVQGVRLVVVLSPDNSLAQVAQSNPQVQFVAINPTVQFPPADNLTIIQSDIQQQAFIAGYLTTLIAFDWRAAGIYTAQETDSEIQQAAFSNGGAYLCGRCAPVYSPIVLFPLITVIPSASDAASWQPAIDSLLQNYPYVIYLSPAAAQPEILRYLAERDLILVGPGAALSDVNQKRGVSAYCDLASGAKLAYLRLENLDISGFHTGITIGAWHSSYSGFKMCW